MELYKEILIHVLSEERVHDSFPNLKFDPAEITEGQCYKALKKAIIDDDSLEDAECFMKIEEIVCALEEIGSNGGRCHDFGWLWAGCGRYRTR